MVLAVATSGRAAEPVIGFRNNGTGAYPDADPPTVWSCTSNVVWRWQQEPLTATTISSLIIVGNKVFTLGHPMAVICLDKNTGKVLWRRQTHLRAHGGTTSVSSADATERVPPQDQLVRAMHEALVRDGRIHALHAVGIMTGKKGGRGAGRMGPIVKGVGGRPSIRREMQRYEKNKSKGYKRKPWVTEKEEAFLKRLVADLKALSVHTDEERAALTKELTELTAKVPGRKDPGFKASGYTCGAAPASDGERVVAVFIPGLVVCYDLEGSLQWTYAAVDAKGKVGKGGLAVVPAVGNGKVVVDRGSFIHCLDVKTGEVVWKKEGLRSGAFGQAAASPVIGHNGGKYYVMVRQQGDVWDLSTGEEVVPAWWRDDNAYRGQMMERYWASGISADRKTLHGITHAVRIPDDPAKPPYTLWKLPLEYVGRKDKPKKVVGGNHQYCAPMITDDKIHFWNTGGGPHRLSTLDAETGKLLVGPMTKGLPGNYPDPIYAGKYIYRFDAGGNCQIRDPEKGFELVADNLLEPGLNQVPVFEGHRMYIRTDLSVYCIEKPEGR